jgi:hypothetical protein
MKVDNMTDSIPPLPHLEISAYTQKHYIDQQSLDRAMRIIYERRPVFFLKAAERDKKWDRGEVKDAKARYHDGFIEELMKFIREEVKKEVNIPTLPVMAIIIAHARAVAQLMYGKST